MFERQRHTQDSNTVPDFNDLLEFLVLRARAGENAAQEGERRCQTPPPEKKAVTRPSYTFSVEEYYVACKKAKHPLCGCRVLYGLSHAQKMTIVKDNGLWLNFLRPGHFVNQCSSTQKCKKCQKPHHSWLHINTQDKEAKVPDTESQCKDDPGVVTTHTSQSSSSHQVLLMTCQVRVTSPDGHATKTRALLDSASSASFITERLAQHLHLPRRHHDMKISSIGGASPKSS